MNERESEECSCEAQSEWSTLSRGREGSIYRWWEKVAVWGTGWPDVRRTSSGDPNEVSDVQKCPDVRAIRKDRTSVEHRTSEGKVYRYNFWASFSQIHRSPLNSAGSLYSRTNHKWSQHLVSPFLSYMLLSLVMIHAHGLWNIILRYTW